MAEYRRIVGMDQAFPQELDFLVNDLRHPKSTTTIEQVLGYIYHYVPYVKHEHNLRVVFAAFLNNPLTFGSDVRSFETNYLIIEAMKFVTERKLKISRPTLPVKKWYSIILRELSNFVNFDKKNNGWKVLPIISGILLANDLRYHLYVGPDYLSYGFFFNDWDNNAKSLFRRGFEFTIYTITSPDIINLSLLSLAVMFKKGDDIKNYISSSNNSLILDRLTDLLFSPSSGLHSYRSLVAVDPRENDVEKRAQELLFQRPVIKHLNKISFLFERFLESLRTTSSSHLIVMGILSKILAFNRELNHFIASSPFNFAPRTNEKDPLIHQLWFLMKNILFSEVLVLQGIMSRFLESRTHYGFVNILSTLSNRSKELLEVHYKEISLKTLHNLYYLNFILLSIGSGGFDSYNFVYYSCLELSLRVQNEIFSFKDFTMLLIGDYNEVNLNEQIINHNYLVRSKVLFVLGLWENYLQLQDTDEQFVKLEIVPMCMNLADDKRYEDIDLIEAAHSVLLIYFSKFEIEDLHESTSYIRRLMNQFPKILSSNQLSIAIETIGKQVLSRRVFSKSHKKPEEVIESFLTFLYYICFPIGPGLRLPKSQSDFMFASAQPIPESDATSTLKTTDGESKSSSSDIVRANKGKKPKDLVKLDLPPSTLPSRNYNFQKRLIPDTIREAIVLSFINLIPYFPLSIFTQWLDKIWILIFYSEADEVEFLKDMLWKVLSENMDLNRSEIAMRWWYETKMLTESHSNASKF